MGREFEAVYRIEWMAVGMEEVERLSNGEVVQMLRDCVWRTVKESWVVQAAHKAARMLMKIQCEAKMP